MNYVGVAVLQTQNKKIVYIVSGDRDTVLYGVPRSLHSHMSLTTSTELVDSQGLAIYHVKKYCCGFYEALLEYESGNTSTFPKISFECRC